MKIHLCRLCLHEDFGHCHVNPDKRKFKHGEDHDLLQCSGFITDTKRINNMFKLKETK
jgi:hypothetical protein